MNYMCCKLTGSILGLLLESKTLCRLKISPLASPIYLYKQLRLPGNHGVFWGTKVVLGLVDVSVADATVQNLHHHIFSARLPVAITWQNTSLQSKMVSSCTRCLFTRSNVKTSYCIYQDTRIASQVSMCHSFSFRHASLLKPSSRTLYSTSTIWRMAFSRSHTRTTRLNTEHALAEDRWNVSLWAIQQYCP
jgi:hypothetical protein